MAYTYLNNTSGGADVSYTRFFLSDGTLISIGAINYGNRSAAAILVDVNGEKKPNKMGIDVFGFYYHIRRNGQAIGKILPNCRFDESNQCDVKKTIQEDCAIGTYGFSCSYAIMANGWKLPTKEDYVRMGGDATKYPW